MHILTDTAAKAAARSVPVVVLLAVSCCGCSSTPAHRTSGSSAGAGILAGQLRAAGGPAPGTPRPASGEIYVFASSDLAGAPSARVKTGADGRFTVSLPPGTYHLAATSPSFTIDPPPAKPPCRGTGPAVVSPGGTSRVDVVCHLR